MIALALGATALQPAVAQDPKGLNVDVGDCVALEKPEERLACFEARVEAARQRTAPAGEATGVNTAAATGVSTAAATGVGTAADRRTPSTTDAAEPVGPGTAPAVHSEKSASQRRSDANGGAAERGSERPPVEIVAKVAALRETVPNTYVITLDNGQVWRQMRPMPYPLRPGLDVRVRETRFGYRLSAPELHGQINVERVR